jgi:hypothetical protein
LTTQPQRIFGVTSIDRAMPLNVTVIANVAKGFKVLMVLSAVETESVLKSG